MKMGGDGDQPAAKPGFSSGGNPYQKPKTRRIWPTIFLKMGGLSPALSKMGGRVPPSPPVAEPLVHTPFPDLANGWEDYVQILCVTRGPLDKCFLHV